MKTRSTPPPESAAVESAGPLGWFLPLTVTLSGALVMVIEVMGSRVIGPFFGVSLFVWTALITVTLVSLAMGYAFGGILADRRPTPDVLYMLLFVAGVLALLVPVLRGPVLKACLALGLRSGALTAAAILFGPALFLLGCVSPYVVRLATRELERLGRTVGLLYALSTLGSFLGTLLTGFVLIAYLGVRGVFVLVGGSLIALAVVYWIVFRNRWLAVLALLLPVLVGSREPLVSRLLPSGTRVTQIARQDGFYGLLQVVDYTYGANHTRELMIDGLVQGGIDVTSGLSVYEYSYLMSFLPWGIRPDGRSCLVVGLGAGVVPRWYQSRGVRTDVVDINPGVVRLAREYFGFESGGELFLDDARRFLARPGRRYDYIVLDVFSGDTTPSHLLSLEALTLVRGRLEPGGILAVNVIGSLRTGSFITASIVRTLEAAFPVVDVYPGFDLERGDGFGNLALIAQNGPRRDFDSRRVESFPVHRMAAELVGRALGGGFRLPAGTPAMILTDDYNPVDSRDLWVKERVRRNILEGVHADILL